MNQRETFIFKDILANKISPIRPTNPSSFSFTPSQNHIRPSGIQSSANLTPFSSLVQNKLAQTASLGLLDRKESKSCPFEIETPTKSPLPSESFRTNPFTLTRPLESKNQPQNISSNPFFLSAKSPLLGQSNPESKTYPFASLYNGKSEGANSQSKNVNFPQSGFFSQKPAQIFQNNVSNPFVPPSNPPQSSPHMNQNFQNLFQAKTQPQNIFSQGSQFSSIFQKKPQPSISTSFQGIPNQESSFFQNQTPKNFFPVGVSPPNIFHPQGQNPNPFCQIPQSQPNFLIQNDVRSNANFPSLTPFPFSGCFPFYDSVSKRDILFVPIMQILWPDFQDPRLAISPLKNNSPIPEVIPIEEELRMKFKSLIDQNKPSKDSKETPPMIQQRKNSGKNWRSFGSFSELPLKNEPKFWLSFDVFFTNGCFRFEKMISDEKVTREDLAKILARRIFDQFAFVVESTEKNVRISHSDLDSERSVSSFSGQNLVQVFYENQTLLFFS